MTMLLTLCAGSLRKQIGRNGSGGLSVLDLPAFAMKQLKLRGLNIPSAMLSGWTLQDLDRLRDRADKAACPCLVLIEDAPLPFADEHPNVRAEAADRVRRLAVAANRLGCSALGIKCEAPDTPEALETAAEEIKDLMPPVERLELNILIAAHQGLTQTPSRLTALIKRIGGFRIGSLPTFAAAASAGAGDPVDSLRKLAPYAGAIHATIEGFTKKGQHKSYDLAACVEAIRSVGFLNTLAIDYTGADDPMPNIEKARDMLQSAIDAHAS